ncbi:MAG: DUF4097 domain-containing protein [bacterium]|nr:DUF4097 domain-containing protein [bacterium]
MLLRTTAMVCLLASAIPAAHALESVERTIEQSRPWQPGTTVRVANLLGSIDVRGAETNEIRLEALVVAEAKTQSEAAALAESIALREDDDDSVAGFRVGFPLERHLSLRLPKAGVGGAFARWTAPMMRRELTVEYDGHLVRIVGGRKATGLAVHLTLTVPFDAPVSARQSVGAIHGRGIRGSVALETQTADVIVEQAFGALDIRTLSGDIALNNFQGDTLNVRTETGDVKLKRVRADAMQLRNVRGNITAADVTARKLRAENASGEIRLAGVEPATADVTTESGSIDVATRLKTTSQATIHSDSGSVTLRIGKLTGMDLHAVTRSGAVKTLGLELDRVESDGERASFRRGRGGPEVIVTAAAGDLTVRPFDATRLEILVGDNW